MLFIASTQTIQPFSLYITRYIVNFDVCFQAICTFADVAYKLL